MNCCLSLFFFACFGPCLRCVFQHVRGCDWVRHLHSGQRLILGLSFFYEQWLGLGLWTELGEDWSDWSLYGGVYGIPHDRDRLHCIVMCR